jgi:hypothetical protein
VCFAYRILLFANITENPEPRIPDCLRSNLCTQSFLDTDDAIPTEFHRSIMRGIDIGGLNLPVLRDFYSFAPRIRDLQLQHFTIFYLFLSLYFSSVYLSSSYAFLNMECNLTSSVQANQISPFQVRLFLLQNSGSVMSYQNIY